MSQPNRQMPLYTPYNNRDDGWWDNLVSEHLQSRLPVIMLTSCGTSGTEIPFSPVGTTGPGDMNPLRLQSYLRALNRAGAAGQLRFGLFAQADAESIYRNYYGLPAGAPFDFANEDAWDQVWWQRIIKPWCDTIPPNQWFLLDGKFPIEFWGLGIQRLYINQQGNVSRMLRYLDDKIYTTYGIHPCYIMGEVNYDTTLETEPSVVGNNKWFYPPSTSFTMTTYKGKVWGGIVAGFIYGNGAYFDPSSPNYQNPNQRIFRNGINGTGVNGDTLKAGLDAAILNNAKIGIIEGWVNASEWNGLYRSDHYEWDYPNQYINILRNYNDLRTVTLRLEAEAADTYVDTTTGNSGGAFRRGGNLDIRALSGAPAASASSTATNYAPADAFDGVLWKKWVSVGGAPAWLQYDYGSGNTEVINGYYLCNGEYPSTQDALNRSPKSWEFQGSNNGTTWTTLDSRTGVVYTAENESKYFSFSNITSYRYYRINVTEVGGGGSNQVVISDMRLMGTNSKGGGWVVTNTAAGESITFRDIGFSPGEYRFPIRYSAAAAGKKVQLMIDNIALPVVTLPATGGGNTFDTISLGQTNLSDGLYDLTVKFIDGDVDLDWLFVKKCNPNISLLSSVTSAFLSAELGGNSAVKAKNTGMGNWEKFSCNDHNGGTLMHNDEISLQVTNGMFLCAELGGGGAIAANRRALGSWEKFRILKTSGSGAIVNGDTVSLQSVNGSNYVSVVDVNTVNVTGTSIGTPQTFTVTFSQQ